MRVLLLIAVLLAQAAPSPPAAGADAGPDALLTRARDEARSFNAALPNFLCRRATLRYESKWPLNWKLREKKP